MFNHQWTSTSPYVHGPPPMGLTSVLPARQVFMSQPIEPSGSFPRVLAGLVGTPHPQLRNMEKIWGESSTRSNLQSEFDVSHVASRPEDRAVEPKAFGECYLNNGSVSGSVAVNRADTYSQGNHGERPKTTNPAGMETGSAGLLPIPGASVQSSGPMEVGHVMPGDLRQPCPPSGSHIIHPPRMDVQSTGAPAPYPVAQGNQVVGHQSIKQSINQSLF